MNYLLVATSISFLIAGNITRHIPLKALWIISSLNHAKQKWIFRLDKSLAHTICVYSIITCPLTINIYTISYWFTCLYALSVFHIFKLSYISGLQGTLWHASLHIVTSTGMVLHYYADPQRVHWPTFLKFLLGFYIAL